MSASPTAKSSQLAQREEARPIAPLSERLLVVRLSAMGDIIHAMPAVAALRRARPQLQIGWLIEERWSALLCSREAELMAPRSGLKPLADWIHLANFSGWRPALSSRGTWKEMAACRRQVQAMHYGTAIDLQGAIRSAGAAFLAGATIRFGSSRPREAPSHFFYTRAVDVQGTHVIEQALSMASAFAEEPLQYVAPPFPTDSAMDAWADQQCAIFAKPLVILNPGAGWGAKCWPAESFGEVARFLAERHMAVLINHGPGEEALAEAVVSSSGGQAVALKCSIGELIAITRRASLFVGGDTGPMHLAAALQVPVVALFGPTRPKRNGPFGTRSVVLQSPQSIHSSTHTDRRDEGLASITPREVIEATEQLLEQHVG